MMRFAVYFAPPAASALWRFGSAVIGYDAGTGEDLPFLESAGLTVEAWSALTEEPRRYGFHGTLKAPFELAADTDAASLTAAVAELATSLRPVELAGLEVAEIGRFIALVPSVASGDLQALAAVVVQSLDRYRGPMSDADRARRLKSPLTARQLAHLDRYGYPYVLDEFRFHMTLTGPIADAVERSRIRGALASAYRNAVAAGPIAIDGLSLFHQGRRDGRFRIVARCPMSGPQSTAAPR